jgi:hypothetical protein
MTKLMNQASEPAGLDLDREATVEVLNRILHMELSGVMQHFHHRWVARWLRSSRPRALAIGQHIATLQGGTGVDVGDLMEDALAGSAGRRSPPTSAFWQSLRRRRPKRSTDGG